MKKFLDSILVIFLVLACAWQSPQDFGNGFLVVEYNLENFFDTINDPLTADDEFTPAGERHWTSARYWKKLIHIWKAIACTDNVRWPDVIGVCEVENASVLQDLLTKTPMKEGEYSFVHRDCDDRRGIDVAVLYRKETFQPLDSDFIKVYFPKEPDYHTRDILYVKGLVRATGDTLHLFMNHWPSRYNGGMYTEPYRCMCAQMLRSRVDSIFSQSPRAKILCIGDFNDTPYNKSVNEDLGAKTDWTERYDSELYNIGYYMSEIKEMWSYWYQGRGDLLDQVIVSGSILGNTDLRLDPDKAYVVPDAFLRTRDGKVNRTYLGPKYRGGYSDHLPVVIRFDTD